ncbi:uncharacterized protein FFMR_10682 [Fusarium fujikuroi]|nr:uncharacterized protein FFE2_12293 [Fusarium fujikuroi]SCO23336.1 uncharacterized protein FFC1_14747 [Fusarium fujikuroi]SCO51690.1 uncharacterized protein FFMR_10682 [Fusarium fujikuroi]SCV56569.1 uncharacterized protein FFFS_12304 [Fusarium fujikuroi]
MFGYDIYIKKACAKRLRFLDIGTASGQKDSDGIISAQGTQRAQYFYEDWAALDIVLSNEETAEIRSFVEKDYQYVTTPYSYGWLLRDLKEESE